MTTWGAPSTHLPPGLLLSQQHALMNQRTNFFPVSLKQQQQPTASPASAAASATSFIIPPAARDARLRSAIAVNQQIFAQRLQAVRCCGAAASGRLEACADAVAGVACGVAATRAALVDFTAGALDALQALRCGGESAAACRSTRPPLTAATLAAAVHLAPQHKRAREPPVAVKPRRVLLSAGTGISAAMGDLDIFEEFTV